MRQVHKKVANRQHAVSTMDTNATPPVGRARGGKKKGRIPASPYWGLKQSCLAKWQQRAYNTRLSEYTRHLEKNQKWPKMATTYLILTTRPMRLRKKVRHPLQCENAKKNPDCFETIPANTLERPIVPHARRPPLGAGGRKGGGGDEGVLKTPPSL